MRIEPMVVSEITDQVIGASRSDVAQLSSCQRDRLTRLLRSGLARSVERVGSEGWHFRCARDGRFVRYSTEGLAFADVKDIQ